MKHRSHPVAQSVPKPAASPAAASALPWSWQHLLFALALTTAVFAVYQPAWRGGIIWDDDQHITRPQLQSWRGLEQIWCDPAATPQYYPLLHSAFWLEHRLWGDTTLGYHLVNITLHCLAAFLVLLVLQRLRVPGAYLAAAIFALHPVQVESVAWITEQKNTLSAVFYLAAALAYLRFDGTRVKWAYGLALLLFVLGLLSKTVTATLPAALLVIFWWKRGRLSWKTDVLPLLPFFILGAAGGVATAWFERKHVGAEGQGFSMTPVERGLIAGRVIWFYLGKLLWPAKLIFIYPRWLVSQRVVWQYLFPLGAAAGLLGLWAMRRRTRAPLAAALFFVGTLFPVLGFLNVYPFLFSFVADHFQYLASLGVITVASAGIAVGLKRSPRWGRAVGYPVCVLLLAALATLTWRQSRIYADIDTLYQRTIDANPGCWMAHDNFGKILIDRGQIDQAVAHFRKSLKIKPDGANALVNLANVWLDRGQIDRANTYLQQAVDCQPKNVEAQYDLGNVLLKRGQVDLAVTHLEDALAIDPRHARANYVLGTVLAGRGQLDNAIKHFEQAVESQPDYARAHFNLGVALGKLGQSEQAIAQFRMTLAIDPSHVQARYSLGVFLAASGQTQEAITQLQQVVDVQPDNVMARRILEALRARPR
jgi:tetratricopeptide (TPR) repeat protein